MEYQFTNDQDRKTELAQRLRELEVEHHRTTVMLSEAESVKGVMPAIDDDAPEDLRQAAGQLDAHIAELKTDLLGLDSRHASTLGLYGTIEVAVPTIGPNPEGAQILAEALAHAHKFGTKASVEPGTVIAES